MRADFGKRAERSRVALDGDHLLGALREQRTRETAGTRSYFDHDDAYERPSSAGDPPSEVEVEEEVLPERLAGVQSMRGDHVPQRRQAVRGKAHRVNRSASLSAAMSLAGLASPFPAMSNAVP